MGWHTTAWQALKARANGLQGAGSTPVDPASAALGVWRAGMAVAIVLACGLAFASDGVTVPGALTAALPSALRSGPDAWERAAGLANEAVLAPVHRPRVVAAGADPVDDDPSDDPPENLAELRERVSQALDRHGVPGVGIALIADGEVLWTGGAGEADPAGGAVVTADTVFRLGSISKTFIALAVMTLVEDGHLRLDADVRELAPEIAGENPWAASDPITVAHLLEHSAGYDDLRFNELFLEPGAGDAPLLAVLRRNPRTRASRWRPGTRFAYSNAGYTEAAYLIEKVTGEPFERYVERRVLRPLGMSTASFTLTPGLRAHLAQGHTGRRDRPVPYRRLYHRPAGELLASPAEVARLVVLMLGRGAAGGERIVRPASIARMERGETRPGPRLDIGYGLGVNGDSSLPVTMFGHDGGLPGFVSEYRYAPDRGLGYVLLFNSTSPRVPAALGDIRALVSAYLLREVELPEPPVIEVPARELARHVGFYEFVSPRHEIAAFLERALLSARVSLIGDGLVLELGSGARLPLIPTSPGRFRFPGFSGPTVAFASRDGARVMQLADFSYEEGDASLGPLRQRALTAAYSLIRIGAFWNFLWIPGWLYLLVRLRHRFPLPPGAGPALAAMCFFAMLEVFLLGLESGALGRVHALSVAFFGLSLLFPALSLAAMVGTLRSLRRAEQERMEVYEALAELSGMVISLYQRGWQTTLYDLGTSAACVGMSVYLLIHGIIGLRTWAW